MKVLLVTPPFTQLNTPYPAAAYLCGYLRAHGHDAHQIDLSIETLHALFSRDFLLPLFKSAEQDHALLKANPAIERMCALQDSYLNALDIALPYLQSKQQQWTMGICYGNIIPQGHRFNMKMEEGLDIDSFFGRFGLSDTAKFVASLYIEELADFIHWTANSRYKFSRYAPELAMSPPSFDELYTALSADQDSIDTLMTDLLASEIDRRQPDTIGITIPFPGNLYTALRCGAYVKQHYDIPVIMGGGFVNTELRDIEDERFFDFCDYLTFDDGELPFLRILNGKQLIRTKTRSADNTEIESHSIDSQENENFSTLPAPDYSDIDFTKYVDILDNPSPMHRLWNEGGWIKYTLAHGCYWAKCAFCDTSLDYIGRFSQKQAGKIVDDLESLIASTRITAFHFVDEAAPPALLKHLSLEILRRGLSLTWWTNIRFEKSFTKGLTRLMARAGCTGVAGGIETAHPRVLKLINKGVSLDTLVAVLHNFADTGILNHGYLMYAFPTQTLEEIIDSLDIVRQMFKHNLLSSAYWHHFNLTAHSPVGIDPDRYSITVTGPSFHGFARNALQYNEDAKPLPSYISAGLEKAIENYMQGMDFDVPVGRWFDGPVPKPDTKENYVEAILGTICNTVVKSNENSTTDGEKVTKVLWANPASQKLKSNGKTAVYRIHKHDASFNIQVQNADVNAFETITMPADRYEPCNIAKITGFKQFQTTELYQQLIAWGLIEL